MATRSEGVGATETRADLDHLAEGEGFEPSRPVGLPAFEGVEARFTLCRPMPRCAADLHVCNMRTSARDRPWRGVTRQM